MYVSDPFDKIFPPHLIDNPIEDDEPRDYHDFFWDDITQGSNHIQGSRRTLHTQVCKFVDGVHTQMARDCPHFNMEDEEGRLIQKGWTAQ